MRKHGFEAPFHSLQILGWIATSLMFGSFFIVIPVGMPYPASVPLSVIYFCLSVVSIASFFIVSLSDAAHPNVIKSNVPLIEEANCYCSLCQVDVGSRTKHCRACDKCVEVFDHHCKWLNTCIGVRNYRSFAIYMSTTLACAFYQAVLCVVVIILAGLDYPAFSARVTSFSLLSPITILVFAAFNVVLGSPLIGFLSHLMGFHLYLAYKKQTTYEHIIQNREEEAARKKQKEIEMEDLKEKEALAHRKRVADALRAQSPPGNVYAQSEGTPSYALPSPASEDRPLSPRTQEKTMTCSCIVSKPRNVTHVQPINTNASTLPPIPPRTTPSLEPERRSESPQLEDLSTLPARGRQVSVGSAVSLSSVQADSHQVPGGPLFVAGALRYGSGTVTLPDRAHTPSNDRDQHAITKVQSMLTSLGSTDRAAYSPDESESLPPNFIPSPTRVTSLDSLQEGMKSPVSIDSAAEGHRRITESMNMDLHSPMSVVSFASSVDQGQQPHSSENFVNRLRAFTVESHDLASESNNSSQRGESIHSPNSLNVSETTIASGDQDRQSMEQTSPVGVAETTSPSSA